MRSFDAELESSYQDLLEENSLLRAQLAAADEELARVVESRWWRIRAPLTPLLTAATRFLPAKEER